MNSAYFSDQRDKLEGQTFGKASRSPPLSLFLYDEEYLRTTWAHKQDSQTRKLSKAELKDTLTYWFFNKGSAL